jgi:HlyD family secretion protein
MVESLRPREKRQVVFRSLVLGALFLGLVTGCASSTRDSGTTGSQFATVEQGSLVDSISTVGSVRARSDITLAFETAGRVSQVLVQEGQKVKAGDTLARLDDADLDLQVRSAQAALAVAQAQLDQLQAGPQRAEVDAAQGQVAATQAAVDQAVAQRDELLAGATEAQIKAAQATLQSARASYNQVKAGPSASDLALAQATLDKANAVLAQAQAAYDRVGGRAEVGQLPESVALQSATIDLRQAQASYNALSEHPTAAELSAASAQVAQAEAQLAQLQASLEPQQRIAQAAVDAAQAQLAISQAQLDSLLAGAPAAEITAAQARVEQAQVAVDSALLAQDRAMLTAPIDGVVAYVGVEVGEYAGPQATAVTLLGESQFSIEADVDEADIGSMVIGQEVQITFDAFPGDALTGRVIAIAPQASIDLGVVSYRVTIETDSADMPLRAGMTANAEVVKEKRDGVLLVPNVAIAVDPETGRKYVMRKTESGVEQVEITTGLTTDLYSEVVSGLAAGDQVVVSSGSNSDILRDMMGGSLLGGGGD